MRSFLIGILTTSALVFSSSLPIRCAFNNPGSIASFLLCGDELSVSTCLSQPDRIHSIESCLRYGGCSEAETSTAAEILRANCYSTVEGEGLEELRKRQNNKKTTASPKTTATPTTDTPTTSDIPTTTNTPSSTPASTTAQTTTTPSSTPSSTAPSTTATSTPSSTQTTMTSTITSASDTATTTPLVCLTTSQSSVTWCITSTVGGSTVSTCNPTFTPVVSCAPGLICQIQPAGDTTCMVRQNNLTTSGLIVTIIFSTIIGAFLIALITMCIKSRRLSRRMALQREAAMVTGSQTKSMRDVEASNTYMKGRGADAAASEAHLPLMAAQGPSGGERSRDVSTDYASTRPAVHRVPSGSYQDVVASRTPVGAPRLHAGLMDTGDEDDMGYGRGRQA